MSKCKEIDALFIDRLYGELDDAAAARFDSHVEGCGGCQSEMESLTATRDLFRDMPEVEPPSSLTAILLHEAAKQAPDAAAAAEDKPGLVARLVGWLSPVMQSPALAAAAMLVLVVGVAGTLYLRGDGKVAQPEHDRAVAASAPESPPAAPAGSVAALRQQAPGLDNEDPADDADKDGYADKATDQKSRGNLGPAYAADVVSESQTKSLNLARKGDEAASGELEGNLKGKGTLAKETKKKQAPRREVATVTDKSKASSTRYRRKTKRPVVANAVTGADPLVGKDNAGDLRLPAGKRTVRLGAVNKAAPAKPKPAMDAPTAGLGGGRAPSAAPPPPSVPQTTAQQRVRNLRDAKAELAWAKARKRELDLAAKRNQCRTVARIANDIRSRNYTYWNANVRRAKSTKPCTKLIIADWNRRSRVRGKRRYARPKRATSGASKPPAAKAAPAEQMSDSAE